MGRLGNPYYMEAEYIHWYYDTDVELRALIENGNWRKLLTPVRYCTHSLGPLLTVLDEDIKRATCFQTGEHGPREEYDPDSPKPDMSCAVFQTPSGVTIRFLRNSRCRADVQGHSYRVFGSEGYIEREVRSGKEVIRFNSELDFNKKLQEVSGEFMPPEYAGDKRVENSSHGGMDWALIDKFIKSLTENAPVPVTLREGLAMTIPGIYAERSAKAGGVPVDVYYPWDPEWEEVIRKEKETNK